MKRSTERILTTHVASLAPPVSLLDIIKNKENGRPYDHEAYAREVRAAVADRVRRQVECGIDIVTDGEMSKVMFIDYVKDHLAGYDEDGAQKSQPNTWKAEIDMFPECPYTTRWDSPPGSRTVGHRKLGQNGTGSRRSTRRDGLLQAILVSARAIQRAWTSPCSDPG